jgi:hypothetical protein
VDLSKITDTYEALIGIGCGAWGFAVSSGFTGVVHAEEPPILFPVPNLPVDVPGLGISTEVRRPFGPLYLRLKLSFTDENIRDGQEGRAGASLYAALRGKHGRLSLKIASADLPDSWTYTLSWGLRGES